MATVKFFLQLWLHARAGDRWWSTHDRSRCDFCVTHGRVF